MAFIKKQDHKPALKKTLILFGATFACLILVGVFGSKESSNSEESESVSTETAETEASDAEESKAKNEPANESFEEGNSIVETSNEEENVEADNNVNTNEAAEIDDTSSDDVSEATEIDIIAGELGEYGKELVLNESSEFEDKIIGYFVPAGTYEIKNVGEFRTQVNVYKNEKITTDEGYEEWADSKVESLDKDGIVEMLVEDGYFINVDEPTHIQIKQIASIDGQSEDHSVDEMTGAATGDEQLWEKYDNEFIASCSLTLDKYIDKKSYKMSLAPQLWTLANYDDNNTVVGITDFTYQGVVSKIMYVATLNFDGDKVTSTTPHYLLIGDTELINDGYCDELFDQMNSIVGNN